jgi:hypothetical protein
MKWRWKPKNSARNGTAVAADANRRPHDVASCMMNREISTWTTA